MFSRFSICLPIACALCAIILGVRLLMESVSDGGGKPLPPAAEVFPGTAYEQTVSGKDAPHFSVTEEEIIHPSGQAENFADIFREPDIPAAYVSAEQMRLAEQDFARSAADRPLMEPRRLVVLPSKRRYFRHELIRLDAWQEPDARDSVLYAVLFRDGQAFPQIAGNYASPFILRKGRLSAYLNTGWNPPLGKYEVRMYSADPEMEFKDYYPVEIEVQARQPCGSHTPGFFAMTIETSIRLRYQVLRAPGGERGDSRVIFDWMDYLGADALWILGSQTAGNDHGLSALDPHNKDTMANVAFLAPEAKSRGYSFGAYIMSYYTPHGGTAGGGYWPSVGYDLRASAHTSLASRKRFLDLARFARSMEENTNVDYIGFDFIRTGEADGFELAERVIDEMNIPVPASWSAMSRRERILWFAREQTLLRRPGMTEAWRWWRAHYMAELLAEVMRAARVTKPVWCFTLGWESGHHHGQDPLMLLDAGITIDAPMLYEANGEQYRAMAHAWRRNAPGIASSLVMGNCVDAILNSSPARSSLEEFYQRNILAVDSFLPDGPPLGLFWHDLGRALFARTGVHSAREWAAAGASAAARLREKHEVWPFRVQFARGQNGMRIQIRATSSRECVIRRVLVYPDGNPQRERVYAQDLALMPDETKMVVLDGVSRDSVLRLESSDFQPYILGFRWIPDSDNSDEF